MANKLDNLLTVPEVAKYLRVNRFTVYRMVERGELPGIRVADMWRFEESDIKKWLQKQKIVSKGKRRKK